MRKTILSIAFLVLSVGIACAQGRKHKKTEEADQPQAITTTNSVPDNVALKAPATTLKAEDMAFTDMVHDFGTVPEGPDATCVFTFVNNGKEPLTIEKAQPSCGCTVPSFSKEPVAPGATGTINVAFHTKGKPATFTKTISVVSNAGTKVLTIKGMVEKAPTSSVPENVSMIRTN